jgi:hypothetical protein
MLEEGDGSWHGPITWPRAWWASAPPPHAKCNPITPHPGVDGVLSSTHNGNGFQSSFKVVQFYGY